MGVRWSDHYGTCSEASISRNTSSPEAATFHFIAVFYCHPPTPRLLAENTSRSSLDSIHHIASFLFRTLLLQFRGIWGILVRLQVPRVHMSGAQPLTFHLSLALGLHSPLQGKTELLLHLSSLLVAHLGPGPARGQETRPGTPSLVRLGDFICRPGTARLPLLLCLGRSRCETVLGGGVGIRDGGHDEEKSRVLASRCGTVSGLWVKPCSREQGRE